MLTSTTVVVEFEELVECTYTTTTAVFMTTILGISIGSTDFMYTDRFMPFSQDLQLDSVWYITDLIEGITARFDIRITTLIEITLEERTLKLEENIDTTTYDVKGPLFTETTKELLLEIMLEDLILVEVIEQ